MKKLSKIQESVWGDLHSRGIGETEREEDKIGNIKDMIPVDMGGSVLWADRDLEIDDNCYFSFDEANELIEKSGWRLPTREEVEELCVSVRIERNTDDICIVSRDDSPDVKMVFNKCGQKYGDNDDKIYRKNTYNTWTSTAQGTEAYRIFKISSLIFGADFQMHKNNKICVRLVKDKPNDIKESVWGDLHKRGIGELEREEDDVNLMDIESFKEYIEHFDDAINKVYLSHNKDFISVDEIYIETEKKNIYYQPLLVIEYPEKKIFMNNQFKRYAPDVFSKLTKEFSVSVKRGFIYINPKDGSEKTNRFFLDVLRFILDNLKNELNESVWGDLHKRGIGELEREEDNIGNLSELKPLDMGLSVLWADKDLEVDGDYLFNFHDTYELIKNSEWRLPTLKEVAELDLLYNTGKYFYDDKSFYFENNGNKLIFYRKGFQYISAYGRKPKNIDEDYYYCWTSDRYDSDCIHILTFDNKKIYHSPVNNRRVTDQIIQRENDELCVRLVKNKKRED